MMRTLGVPVTSLPPSVFSLGAGVTLSGAAAMVISQSGASDDLVRSAKGACENGAKIDAICFRAFDGPIGTLLENHNGRLFHCAGRLEIDDWGGRRRAKMRLEDVAEVI